MLENQIVYTFTCTGRRKKLTMVMLESGCKGVAYETIEDAEGLPCLKPMSEIAGRL